MNRISAVLRIRFREFIQRTRLVLVRVKEIILMDLRNMLLPSMGLNKR